MDTKRYAIVDFENNCYYEVETEHGTSKGQWYAEIQAFRITLPDGTSEFREPSCLDPTSGLVAWKKL